MILFITRKENCMNFVAIDFETANEKRNSPCSLGLTIVRDNQIIKELYWLIKPPEMRFRPINIMIHGIRPHEVEDAKEFDKLWPEIYSYLEGNIILAHNASFDMSVLKNTLDTYHLPYPTLSYVCTMICSKQYYPFLENAKLDTVNRHLGHTFNHHHASADATACARIFLQIIEELGTDDLEVISSKLGFSVGSIYHHSYKPCRKLGRSMITSSKPMSIKEEVSMDPTKLAGQVVALTGPLHSMSRMEAIQRIYDLGGTYSSTVTKKTTILVTNTKKPEQLEPSLMSSKLRKAMMQKAAGQSIHIHTEAILLP